MDLVLVVVQFEFDRLTRKPHISTVFENNGPHNGVSRGFFQLQRFVVLNGFYFGCVAPTKRDCLGRKRSVDLSHQIKVTSI